MPIQQKCFLTGLPAQVNNASGGVAAYIVTSPACGQYWVSRRLAASSDIWERYADRLHILAAVVRQRTDAEERVELHGGNLDDFIASIDVPETPLEKIDLILQHIRSNTSHPGEAYHFDRTKDFPIAFARNIGEWDFLFAEALKAGFIEGDRHSGKALLTLKGWERIGGRSTQPQATESTSSGQRVGTQQEAPMTNQPHVFLCHASEDKEQVMGVYKRLKTEGFKPWIDKEDLLPGQDWDREIRREIKRSDFVLVFFSKLSVSKQGYYQRELKLLLEVMDEMPEGQIFVIPVRLDECKIPDKFKKYQHANLFESDGFEKIVKAMKAVDTGHSQEGRQQTLDLTLQQALFYWQHISKGNLGDYEARLTIYVSVGSGGPAYLPLHKCSCSLTVPDFIDSHSLEIRDWYVPSDSKYIVQSGRDLAIEGSGYFYVEARVSAAEVEMLEGYTGVVKLSFRCLPDGATQPILIEENLTYGKGKGRKSGGDWRYPSQGKSDSKPSSYSGKEVSDSPKARLLIEIASIAYIEENKLLTPDDMISMMTEGKTGMQILNELLAVLDERLAFADKKWSEALNALRRGKSQGITNIDKRSWEEKKKKWGSEVTEIKRTKSKIEDLIIEQEYRQIGRNS